MIDKHDPTRAATRVYCEAIGRPKLLAEIISAGISVWCHICHRPHVIPRAIVIAAWEKGDNIQIDSLCSVS